MKAERALQPDRAARVEPQLLSQAQRERAEAERKPAAHAEVERAARAERERAEAERQRAAEAERERAAQAEAERAAQAEAERAAQAEAERAAQAEAERAAAAGLASQAAREQADGTNAESSVAKPEAAVQPGQGRWLAEDYFRPLSAPRSPVDRRAELARKAQEEKEAQWDERIPWDEQAPWHEQAQPEERAQPDVLNASRGHSRRTSTLAAIVVAVVIAGSVGIALALRSTPTNPHGSRAAPAATIRSQAVAWVAQQVSHNTVVSCDHSMCATLAEHHFPAGNLHVLNSASSNPAGSTVIIATPTVRSQFGSSLGSSLAPLVLARFGTGSAQIDIRLVAPHGPTAYRHEVAGDVLARKASGTELLSNSRIHASATARKQLTAGQVDPRLLVVIAVMAAQSPVDILGFSDSGPHASEGVPFRVADLAETNGTAQPGWTRAMLALLQTQSDQFLPAKYGTTSRAGNVVLYVQFPAPSPLGLLGPTIP